MLTLWAIFNILCFLDVSSVLAETPASCKLRGEEPQPPYTLEGSVGVWKSWCFKVWFGDRGLRAPSGPPLSFTLEFTLAGPCLLPPIPFNGPGLSCKYSVF